MRHNFPPFWRNYAHCALIWRAAHDQGARSRLEGRKGANSTPDCSSRSVVCGLRGREGMPSNKKAFGAKERALGYIGRLWIDQVCPVI